MADELGILVPIFAIVFGTMIPILWNYQDQLTKQKLIEGRHKERLAVRCGTGCRRILCARRLTIAIKYPRVDQLSRL